MALRTLSTSLRLYFQPTHQDNTEDYGGVAAVENIPIDDFLFRVVQTLAMGTAADEANLVYHDHRYLLGAEDIDLAGVLVDKFGGTLTFTFVKAMIFYNHDAANTLDILGTAAANQEWDSFRDAATATEPVLLQPGGMWLIWAPGAGYAVGAGASDLVHVDAGANTIEYDFVVVGVGTRAEDEPTTTTTTVAPTTTTTAAPTTTTA